MAEPQIRYCTTSDGVSIAYWTMGEGRPLFVSSPLTFSHAGLEPRIPAVAAFYARIAGEAMLVRWDPRNYGMSQRGDTAASSMPAASEESIARMAGKRSSSMAAIRRLASLMP